MSYDLYFLPREICDNPHAVQRHLAEPARGTDPSREARKKRLADALVRENPQLEAFVPDDEAIAASQDAADTLPQAPGDIELNGPEDGPGIQITISADSACIAVPYWHAGPKAIAIFSEIERYAAVIAREAGYRIFDPQLNRVFDALDEARGDILKQYGAIVRRMPQILGGAAAKKKPWWKLW